MNTHSMEACSSLPVAPKTPITGEVDHLLNAIGILDDTVDSLTNRLDNVLSPELTVNEGMDKGQGAPPVSLLNARITQAGKGIDDINGRLQRLLQRLEI